MSEDLRRLPTGVGTGIGSMPGTDPREAVRIAAGEVDLPFLPELPARGVGADLIGRTGTLLVDLPVDMVHRTYRLVDHPNSTTRRSRDWLRWDLDAIEEHWETSDRRGGVVKVQACGPLTLSAHIELRGGHKIVKDRGAVRDVTASLTEGLREHVADVRRRLGADVVVQLDEPDAGRVIDGTVTPLTRLDPIRPIPAPEAAELLQSMIDALDVPVLLHSCHRPRWDLTSRLSGIALSLDVTDLRPAVDYDPLGTFLDGGGVVAAGLVPSSEPAAPLHAEPVARELAALIDRIGLPRAALRDNLLVTPTCGLAGATPDWATRALALSSQVASGLAADPDFASAVD
ncbi:vitamin-B12 independent methionine synthase [Gordonia hydrophobica]|uniref:Vitamin-B12 independent methionine synthase n=1 Tax=Gordonia hydrophobica TaxID=40516 RepID=A0ABZ2U2E9_9ACTN|nr:vitamin-B12 independent methionine synthase [Gordonia hydrophobica]MBM7366859.1 methionine synthase II (cobalamin-independent) [Gordonia hydrophobica]